MGLAEWLTAFRQLHERARAGALDADDLQSYEFSREELAKTILATQRIALKTDQVAREHVRVQRSLQVDLVMSGTYKLVTDTLDISLGGFSAMLSYAPVTGETAAVKLHVPGKDSILEATASIGGSKRLGAAYRVSFAFGTLPDAVKDRLSFLVFDTVLESLRV